MKLSSPAIFTLSAVVATGVTAVTMPVDPYTEVSEEFSLTIRTLEPGKWGQYLFPAHAGAGDEVLALDVDPPQWKFYVASTPDAPTPYFSTKPVGVLSWVLVDDAGESPPSTMRYFDDEENNKVALFRFGPPPEGDPQPLIGFDREGRMYAYVEGETEEDAQLLYEWFICPVTYNFYKYDALVWVPGKNPSNATCFEVTVVRE
jgi:hypothetical protein